MADTTALVPVFSGVISNITVQLCDARALHAFMGVGRDFTNWIKGRIAKFGFVAGEDFITVENLSSPDLASAKARQQKLIDYHLTLDMAKELAMVENNAQGRAARKYFIACERKLNAPQPLTIPALPGPADAQRIQLAFSLAAHVAAQAQRAVFDAVMAGDNDWWQYNRYLLAFVDKDGTRPTEPWSAALAPNQFVTSIDEMADYLSSASNGGVATDIQLARLARVCSERLERRADARARREQSLNKRSA